MTRSRVERYWVDLLDKDENFVRNLTKTAQGSLTWDITQPIQKAGKIRALDDGTTNWAAHRLQIWYQKDDEVPWSMGIYVATSPSFLNRVGLYEFPLEIHDKTRLLQDDVLDDVFYLTPSSQSITEAVESLILTTYEPKLNITHSTAKARDYLVWKAGTPKLEIINELLVSINYKNLFTDDYGYFQVEPYLKPEDTPLMGTFIKGKEAIHASSWSLTRDLPEVPNKVVLVAKGSSEDEGIQGVAINNDPNSPTSTVTLGKTIAHVEEVEAESPSVITQLAQRRLIELASPYGMIDIEHLVIKRQLGDKMRLISGRVDFVGTIERMDFTLKPGSLCSATWRQANV